MPLPNTTFAHFLGMGNHATLSTNCNREEACSQAMLFNAYRAQGTDESLFMVIHRADRMRLVFTLSINAKRMERQKPV